MKHTSSSFWTACLLLLNGALAAPSESPELAVTQPPPPAAVEPLPGEVRAQKDREANEDPNARSAYINNQYMPDEPVELDDQDEPLYEILQKQMEQVLAATGPDVPIYADPGKPKRQRVQQPPQRPSFTNAEVVDTPDYEDADNGEDELSFNYAEQPLAAGEVDEYEAIEDSYQQLDTSTARPVIAASRPATTTTTSTTMRVRPTKRRSTTTTRTTTTTSTTALPHTTRSRNTTQPRPSRTTTATAPSTTPSSSSSSPTIPASAVPSVAPSVIVTGKKTRPQPKPLALPHNPHVYQRKRHIVFKTISTGSQFVNSPIGDLMIKFSIGYAKQPPAPGAARNEHINEVLRTLSSNLVKSIELQKLKRVNKVQRESK